MFNKTFWWCKNQECFENSVSCGGDVHGRTELRYDRSRGLSNLHQFDSRLIDSGPYDLLQLQKDLLEPNVMVAFLVEFDHPKVKDMRFSPTDVDH